MYVYFFNFSSYANFYFIFFTCTQVNKESIEVNHKTAREHQATKTFYVFSMVMNVRGKLCSDETEVQMCEINQEITPRIE